MFFIRNCFCTNTIDFHFVGFSKDTFRAQFASEHRTSAIKSALVGKLIEKRLHELQQASATVFGTREHSFVRVCFDSRVRETLREEPKDFLGVDYLKKKTRSLAPIHV